MPKKKKGPGGKLNRSEIVQTRLSPKLRWAAEILARKDRRTASSFIEGLVEKAALNETVLMERSKKDFQNNIFYEVPSKRTNRLSIKDAVEYMWSDSEGERFVAFAIAFTELLTPDEEKMWQFINLNFYFWECFTMKVDDPDTTDTERVWPIVDYHTLRRDHLNAYWSIIYGVYMEGEPLDKICEVPGDFDHVGDIRPPNYPIIMKKRMKQIEICEAISKQSKESTPKLKEK